MKKFYSLWLIALIVNFFITGCAKKEAEKKEITFMMWGNPIEIKQMEGWLKDFEEENPGIKVKLIHSPKYLQQLLTMCAGGTPPDVMMIDDANVCPLPACAEKGILLPLDKYIDKEWKESMYERAWKAFRWKGVLYGVPREINPWILFYNKNLLDEEGVPYPDETWDWKKFIQVAAKLTKKEDGRIVQYGLVNFSILDYARSYGSKGFFDEEGNFVFDPQDSNIQKGLSLYLELIDRGIVPFPFSEDGRDTEALFLSGRAAFYFNGPWFCMSLAKRGIDFDWNMALVPKGDKGRFPCLNVTGYSVHRQAKHKEECIKLVRFLTSAGILSDLSYTGRAFPAWREAARSFLKSPKYKPYINRKVVEKSLPFAKSPITSSKYTYSKYQEIGEVIRIYRDKILLIT